MRRYACALLFGLTGWAQSLPEFEVASIKQVDKPLEPGRADLSFLGTSGKPIAISGNRMTLRGTVRAIIAAAFNVKNYQVSAVPSWADSQLYIITATTAGDAAPTQEQVRPMLQSLLADRFQLKFHRDTKEMAVYHLTPGKGSIGLKPAGPDEKFGWEITAGPGGAMRSKATRESIGDFVQLVGVSADRPVIDKTGVTGDIDYEILVPQQDIRTMDDQNHAILDAVKDQLGLKLEPTRDAIEILVVDRVEKPSAN